LIGDITQVALGGILALMILREVFQYLAKRKAPPVCALESGPKRRPTNEQVKLVQSSVEAVLLRLDQIVERLEDVASAVKSARKQSEITGEMAERMTRAVSQLERTVIETLGRHRTADTSPGA
jgi:hypothetical protein